MRISDVNITESKHSSAVASDHFHPVYYVTTLGYDVSFLAKYELPDLPLNQ